MKTNLPRVVGVLVAILITGTCLKADLNDWVQQAVSTDDSVALAAQKNLREAGPAGLEALEKCYMQEIGDHQKGASTDEAWKKIATALNRVGGQYDEYASGLYWYTDLEKAKTAAQASGKPILSLRLLGRLDEDLSCANSRFFRTTLYPNAQVNQLLRNKFVLHWETFRPVPVVTIDFGDGRKLTRTITGNSIHYVLASDGSLIDALPGLYGAKAFARELQLSADAATQSMQKKDFSVATYQAATRDRLLAAWKDDLNATKAGQATNSEQKMDTASLEKSTDEARWKFIADRHMGEADFDSNAREVMSRKFPDIKLSSVSLSSGNFPSAETAAPLAVGKGIVEVPLLKSGVGNPQNKISFDATQSKVAFTTAKFPPAETAAPLALSKTGVESPLLRAIRNLRNSVALDTVRNNYLLRTKILAYLQSPAAGGEPLSQINDTIYAQIFLTPKDDPWLGLEAPDIFTGIDQNGETQ